MLNLFGNFRDNSNSRPGCFAAYYFGVKKFVGFFPRTELVGFKFRIASECKAKANVGIVGDITLNNLFTFSQSQYLLSSSSPITPIMRISFL